MNLSALPPGRHPRPISTNFTNMSQRGHFSRFEVLAYRLLDMTPGKSRQETSEPSHLFRLFNGCANWLFNSHPRAD